MDFVFGMNQSGWPSHAFDIGSLDLVTSETAGTLQLK